MDEPRKHASENSAFPHLFDHLLEGVQIFDHDWNCLYVNDVVVRNSGYPKEELMQLKPFERFPGVERTTLFARLKECMEARRAEHFDTAFQFPDGTVGHFELRFLPVPEGIAILSINRTEQKQASEKVQATDRKFRALIEKSTGMKTLTSSDGILLYGSPAVTSVLGYELEEFVGTQAASYLHPDDLPHLAENRTLLLEKPGESFAFLYRFRRKDGRWIWCEGTLTNQLHDPAINAMVTNFVDVTERKRLADEREFDKSNLDALINNTSDLMWSIDRDFRLVTANRAFDETMRMLIGKTVEKGSLALDPGFPEENLKRFRSYYERALAGETVKEVEHATEPVEYWSEITYSPIRDGDKIVGAACYSHDITAIKQTEAQLKRSEQSFREAQEIAHLGSWYLDLQTALAVWSEECCRIYGIPPEENRLSLLDWMSYVHPEDFDYVSSTLGEAGQTLTNADFNHRIVLRDGTVKHIYAKSVFVFDAAGVPIGLNGIAHDVTELKKTELYLEQRVEDRTRELTEKNSSILDSINYAKRIQLGLLTRKSQLFAIFPKAFILSRPRDIVSGDFFWCYQSHGKKFVAVADCTGHGVPGALLSIIGNNLLNRIIVDEHIENPSEILEELDKRLAEAVKADTQDIRDGMDIVLCVVDTYFNELYFVGAYRPVFLSDETGKILEFDGARHAIGGGTHDGKKFGTRRVPILPGQRMYLTSDGYYSQFGGPKGKKFMKSRFVQTLESIQEMPIGEQEAALQNILAQWTGEGEQVDDIMVVGIEL